MIRFKDVTKVVLVLALCFGFAGVGNAAAYNKYPYYGVFIDGHLYYETETETSSDGTTIMTPTITTKIASATMIVRGKIVDVYRSITEKDLKSPTLTIFPNGKESVKYSNGTIRATKTGAERLKR